MKLNNLNILLGKHLKGGGQQEIFFIVDNQECELVSITDDRGRIEVILKREEVESKFITNPFEIEKPDYRVGGIKNPLELSIEEANALLKSSGGVISDKPLVSKEAFEGFKQLEKPKEHLANVTPEDVEKAIKIAYKLPEEELKRRQNQTSDEETNKRPIEDHPHNLTERETGRGQYQEEQTKGGYFQDNSAGTRESSAGVDKGAEGNGVGDSATDGTSEQENE